MQALVSDFQNRSEVLSRHSVECDDYSMLPSHILGTLRMWEKGDDLSSYSRAKFYRHRAALLPHGVDIAVKSNVVPFQPRVRVIRLCPVQAPEWYEPPSRFVEFKNGTFG